jgi:hypothetical protein
VASNDGRVREVDAALFKVLRNEQRRYARAARQEVDTSRRRSGAATPGFFR